MRMIDERPAEVEDRLQTGHWEGDLIMGAGTARRYGVLLPESWLGTRCCAIIRAMGQARERRRQAGEVRVAVTRVARSHDVTTTEVRLEAGEWPFDPIAPATVWTDDDRRVVDLHCLVRMDGDEATFESYDLTGETPQPGGPYRIFSWWDPNQFRAATDRNVRWHRRTYDKPDDHTHCLLTWKTIDHGTTAYQVDDAGWITVDAYEKYIRDDALRLRRAVANP